jgi:hypothetical protein
MTPVTAAKVKYGVWGLICGAIIAMIIGFAWGGWTLGSGHLYVKPPPLGLVQARAQLGPQLLAA